MKKKDIRIHLRASSEQAARINTAAIVLDVPASQLIRDAVDEKLDRLAKRIPSLRREEAQAA